MGAALADIAEVRMGYPFRGRIEPDPSGNVTVIQMKDIDESNLLHPEGLVRIRMDDMKDRHLVREGDLLFRSRGISNSAALVAADLGRAVLAAPMMLIRPHPGVVHSAYLQWFINHSTTQSLLTGQSVGTAVKMISKAALDGLVVELPALEEQHRIVEIARLGACEAKLLEELKERRKALLEGILMRKAKDAR